MKSFPNLALSVATLLSLAAASAASAATIASQYTLLPPTANDIANPTYNTFNNFTSPLFTLGVFKSPSQVLNNLIASTDFSGFPINVLGQGVILEQGSNPANNATGKLAVVFDPANPSLGLVNVGPASITAGATGVVSQTIFGISALGYVSGNSLNSLNNSARAIPWLYVPGTGATVLGLTGALGTSLYEPSSTVYSQTISGTAGNGWVVGTATRYGNTAGSVTLGSDTWYYNPTSAASPAIVPLINSAFSPASTYQATNTTAGLAFSTNQSTVAPVFTSASGVIVGASTRFLNATYASGSPTNYGADTWLYNAGAASPATSATQIGLLQDTSNTNATYSLATTFSSTNSGVVRSNSIYTIGATGTIGGATNIYNAASFNSALGTVAWLYTPGSAPSTINFSYASAANNSFANSPTPGVLSDGSGGKYAQVGLIDSTHLNTTGFGTTTVSAINPSGQAAGTSLIYKSNGTSASSGTGAYNGSDAWYYSQSTGTVKITPVTSSTNFSLSFNYVSGAVTATVRSAGITGINSKGWVAGISQRFDYNATGTSGTALTGTNASPFINSPLGFDAWIFNADNQQTYLVDEAVNNANGLNGYFFSVIQYLSDDGIALGYYGLNPAVGADADAGDEEHIFAYSIDAGGVGHFYDLGAAGALTNTIASAGWSSLSSLISIDANGNLYGTGITSTGANGVFELQAVPEPASLGVMVIGGLGLLARRRKV